MIKQILIILMCSICISASLSCRKTTYESIENPETECNGIITANDTYVRIDPFIFSSMVTRTDKGTRVKILAKSSEKNWIGKNCDYWYKIKLNDGAEGWTFGGNVRVIDAMSEDKIMQALSDFWEEEGAIIKRDISGKWWSINSHGSFTDHSLELKPDGRYISYKGSSPELKDEGDYNINYINSSLIFLNNTSFEGNLVYRKKGGSYILENTEVAKNVRFKKIVSGTAVEKSDENKNQ